MPFIASRPMRAGLGLVVLLATIVAVTGPVRALDVPSKPTDVPVVDQTGTLTDDQKQALAAKISAERSATGNQIAILMVKSLDSDSLEDYSLKVARSWGVGQKDRDSGVLLFVAKDDHKLRIEVGYGLEGALTDIRSGQIIRQRITPDFRDGKYYEGIDSGVDGIVTAIHGERDPNLKTEEAGAGNGSGVPWEFIIMAVFFVPVWLASILGRTKSWWAGGAIGAAAGIIIGFVFGFMLTGFLATAGLTVIGLIFDKIVSANYRQAAGGGRGRPSWWAGGPWIGGGGLGGGGGGFGGFSGGSFGGGGSSGSW